MNNKWLLVILILFVYISIYFIVAGVYRKDRENGKKTQNLILNLITIFILVWKISPIITSFDLIVKNWIYLVYAPGNIWGMLTGVMMISIYLFFYLRKNQMQLKKLLITFIASLAVTTGSIIFYNFVSGYTSGQTINLSSLTLTDTNGINHTPGEVNGRLYVLNFFATWCVPCQSEMPLLNLFYGKIPDDSIELIGINLASSEKKPEALYQFLSKHSIQFPVYADQNGRLSALFNIQTIPVTIIIRNGKILKRFDRIVSREELFGYLKP